MSCSTLDWELHLYDVHNQKFSGLNLISARNMACRISPKRAEEAECPLCRVVLGKPRSAFVKHVCRHMEDIALMALPSNAEEDSEIGSISTDPNSNKNSDTSKDLHIDEEYTIKCICGLEDDDGNTVYCEQCDTWQHTECYYRGENGIIPTMDVLSSIDHICAECKPRLLDTRAAMERQENRRAQIACALASVEQGYETTENRITIASPKKTQQQVISPPNYLPPPERSPTPERMSRLKRRERKRRTKAQAYQGDTVLLWSLAGTQIPQAASSQPPTAARTKRDWPESVRLYVQRAFAAQNKVPGVGREEMEKKLKQVISESAESDTLTVIDWANIPLPQHIILDERQRSGVNDFDPASKVGKGPLPEEGDKSKDEDEEESENASVSTQSLHTAKPGVEWRMSPKDHQYGQTSNESAEAPQLEDLNSIGPFVGQRDEKRRARRLSPSRLRSDVTPEGREHAKDVRKVQACNDCRRAKRKVSVLAGCGVQSLG